jgi:FAD/FMN-containing dehydrogenase
MTVAGTDVAASLREWLDCPVLGPRDAPYDEARLPWNRTVDQHPAAIVEVTTTVDVADAVRAARDLGLGVGVQATGHGAVHPCDGLLLDTSALRGVRVDAASRTAEVAAGTPWSDVLAAAAEHGLAPLAGTAPDVGVVGYLLGGGYGWLSRRHGLAADSLLAASLVTGTGETVRADPELLWGLRGGGGNFGVVTSVRIGLFPIGALYGGALVFPLARAAEVLAAYREWTDDLSEDVGSVLATLRLPPALASLAPLDGRLIQVLLCDAGGPAAGAERLAPLRALGPEIDRVRAMPVTELGSIAADSTGPMPLNEHGHLVGALTPELGDLLLAEHGPDAEGGLPLLAVRQLGGALSTGDACFSHREAGFLVNGTGADLNPELAERVDAQQEDFSRTLAPFEVGGAGLNFIGKPRGGREADDARTRAAFDDAAWDRLVALKRAYDPDGLFRFGHTIAPS